MGLDLLRFRVIHSASHSPNAVTSLAKTSKRLATHSLGVQLIQLIYSQYFSTLTSVPTSPQANYSIHFSQGQQQTVQAWKAY